MRSTFDKTPLCERSSSTICDDSYNKVDFSLPCLCLRLCLSSVFEDGVVDFVALVRIYCLLSLCHCSHGDIETSDRLIKFVTLANECHQRPPTMASLMEHDQHPKKPVENDTSSAFGASTLMTDVEKQRPSNVAPSGQKRPGNLFGAPIDTATTGHTAAGVEPVYAAKAQLLNEARLDMGMGRYEWSLFLATAVGWFLDEVCCFWPIMRTTRRKC